MPKRSSPLKLIIRLVLVLAMIILAFIGILLLLQNKKQTTINNRNIFHKSFGIVLPSGYTVHGIDVSRHQDEIDWQKVESMRSDSIRISFVFIKATEGITRQDPSFEQNWKAIKKTKLIRGAYHFYYPSRDALKQAKNFISQVNLVKGDLPPVVDIEYSNGKSKKKICEGLTKFVNEIEKKYKVKPIIYTNLSFYNDYLDGEFDSYPVWISCYFEQERFNSSCSFRWKFWQHSEQGKVNGIAGNVDFNVFNGGEKDLLKLCIP